MSEGVLLRDPAFRDAGLFFPSPAGPRGSLLGLEGMPAGEVRRILDHAADLRETWRRDRRLTETLKGVAVANAFFEDSTRTRLSFELAQRRLGAVVLSISNNGSSVSKGESLLDTVRT